jgi:hypothetical protein
MNEGMDDQGMDEGAEPTTTPHGYASVLRQRIIADVAAAITSAVARFGAEYPSQPWRADHRPGAANVSTLIDLALDDVLEAVLVREVEGRAVGFPSRIALAP